MICRNCQREIPDNSLFCNWCGEKQLRERKKRDEIKVPKPTQLPSGNWRIVLRAEGQSITEATPELCIAKAKAIRAGFVEKQAKAPTITLSAAIDNYITSRDKTLSPATIRGYRTAQRNRFQSVMEKPIGKITNWQELCNAETSLCGPKTLQNAWGLVSSALAYNGVTPPKVKLPQVVTEERPWLTPEEIKIFVAAVHGKPFEIPALLGLSSLRRSEICAITWDKIDTEKGTITVSGAMVPNENHKFVLKKENKTQSSRRTIPIFIPQLKEAVDNAHPEDTSALIFTESPNTLRSQINRLCRENDLPEVGVHGLRHSFASLAYHLQIPELETVRLGGWSNSQTVHKIYTHLSQRDKTAAVTKIEDFFRV